MNELKKGDLVKAWNTGENPTECYYLEGGHVDGVIYHLVSMEEKPCFGNIRCFECVGRMVSDELKSCPFCGGEANINDMGRLFGIMCSVCEAGVLGERARSDDEVDDATLSKYRERTAIDKWNARSK